MARLEARRHVDGQRWPLVHVFSNDPGVWLPLPARVIGGIGWLSTARRFLDEVSQRLTAAALVSA